MTLNKQSRNTKDCTALHQDNLGDKQKEKDDALLSLG